MNATKATAILLVHLLLLVVAMPGVSFLKSSLLSDHASEDQFERRYGSALTQVAQAMKTVNTYRRPLAKTVGGFQPVFRIRQAWHLYRDGPSTIRRMEILVDGTVVYRTNDPEFDWQQAIFRNRRIRPMAETLVKKPRAKNRIGLARFIVQKVQEDFPDAERVDIVSRWGGRGGPGKVHHSIVARAPTWTLEDRK